MADVGKFISSVARKGAEIENCGKMCNECAFREGSEANKEIWTIAKAEHALLNELPFNCHIHNPDGTFSDAGKECTGMKYARKYFANLEEKSKFESTLRGRADG